ncbi:DNA-binding transcriptional response regulator, NtrC family, contains REC, AAA-type ATPase, and a Fis-type DNA-binding domains [Muriicola jejuensis]|uniref:AAA domain-containing protein n=1 Tax=Muriicola jejuensis TaxID=504488 RepID=A0A6P0UF79_9FLAO|nr:sigma-54 dependent transcriptional regulator [Muriicola jejuensis]NER11667.1 AAA domain-containing protein [Muriicola jejuensis]SMP25534.1 DNA-binding transcriptional response regulator, NtrC family, contains REC, AAA-type ATPase, and a Fis-type DNA-binding domains [Muriicola jejuensis]
MESVQAIKQRFGIIGNDPKLNRALEKAIQVAPTDISVLVTGESGVGKEAVPKIIHSLSHRKHAKYIAVNCGAIPEGTIDSELFGHEKGAFTGATQTRSGYFEVADGGTIFLDEVGELPLTTQVRLLRILENGEFLKVGSSQVQKTNVRIVAATNLNMIEAIKKGKFREDLYYRLSTVDINIPPLRERKDDIHLLFRKFASDFSQKYKMPTIRLEDDAVQLLEKYRWPGNIRQLRNVAEQISVLEESRSVSPETLNGYLPHASDSNLPAVVEQQSRKGDFSNEREILYKVLFDMKADLNDLKKLTLELLHAEDSEKVQEENETLIRKIYGKEGSRKEENSSAVELLPPHEHRVEKPVEPVQEDKYHFAEEIEEEETLSLQEKEIELIKKSLERNRGKRKAAASELGISERTLYRKIKQYDL